MATHSFKDLQVWQRSMSLAERCYGISGNLPAEERFGLSDQLRRSAVSVPANLAEGQKRNSKKEFIQYCSIARGSLAELETHLELCKRIYQLNADSLIAECDELGRMITALVKSQEDK